MLRFSRSYSTPQFKKSGNILFNALNYVKEVDEFQEKIGLTPEKELATKLVSRVHSHKELLYLLLMFHHDLAKIGISQSSGHLQPLTAVTWRYRASLWKLARVHNVFWDQARLVGISERNHKIGWLPDRIGVLDPLNFEREHYRQLQEGKFGETDFRDVEMLGGRKWAQETEP